MGTLRIAAVSLAVLLGNLFAARPPFFSTAAK
jgi:hypothetical protein